MNVVVVRGCLSRAPVERVLPSGNRLAALEVTIPASGPPAGRTDPTGGRAESVPVAWPSPPAWGLALDAGAEVVVLGRVRRRFFRVGPRTESRTEVVADRVVPARRVGQVNQLLDRASQALAHLEVSRA